MARSAPQTGDLALIEAAARLQLSYHATLRLVLVGQLEGRREDGRWRVSRESLAEMLAARARAPRRAPDTAPAAP
jgi:hypothetical protein